MEIYIDRIVCHLLTVICTMQYYNIFDVLNSSVLIVWCQIIKKCVPYSYATLCQNFKAIGEELSEISDYVQTNIYIFIYIDDKFLTVI